MINRFNLSQPKDALMKEYSNIISTQVLQERLLQHELTHFLPTPSNLDLTKFAQKAQDILLRYQSDPDAKLLDDNIWSLHTPTSTEYSVVNNEILFVNTIIKHHYDKSNTKQYIKHIIKQLNNLSPNINVTYERRYLKKDDLLWLMIWCSTENKVKISL